MNKLLIENYIRNLKKDIKIIKNNNYHERTVDLQRMVLEEDIMEVISFVEKVNKVLNFKTPEVVGQFEKGYLEGIQQIKREIYEE